MPSKASSDQGAWTLLFKKHRTTTLLLVQPTQSFSSIKTELLVAIRASGKTEINNEKLPSSSDTLKFGALVDKNDPSQGWEDLEPSNPEDSDGKAKTSTSEANPMSAGLKDGSMLAFKFGEDAEWDVIMPSYDDEIEG